MPLRDYQIECVNSVVQYYFAGVTKQLCVSPTGTGKAVLLAQLPSAFEMAPGEQMLVLVHRKELVNQLAEKLSQYNPSLKVGVERAHITADPDSDIIVASVQTIGMAKKRQDGGWDFCARLRKLDPERIRYVIVDEVHHALGASYGAVLRYLRCFKPEPEYDDPTKLLAGFTATPKRSDSVGLETILDRIVFHREIRQMVKAGWLARPKGYIVETEVDLSGVTVRQGDFATKELERTVNTPDRNNLIVEKYKELGEGMLAFAFTVDVQHAVDVAAAFTEAGIPAAAISGETDDDTRKHLMDEFRAGRLRVLSSAGVLSEGIDIPQVGCGLMCRPTKSSLLYTQQVGRVLRPYPAPEQLPGWQGWIKPHAVIVDFSDVCTRHSLSDIATLFGLPPRFNIKGQDAVEVAEEVEALAEKAKGAINPSLFKDLQTLRGMVERIDLLAKPTVPEEVRTLSKYGWITGTTGGFTLLLPDKTSFSVREDLLGAWHLFRHVNGIRTPLGEHTSLQDALAAGDKQVPPEARTVLSIDAKWRFGKVTEPQARKLCGLRRDLRSQFKSFDEFFAFLQAQYSKGEVSDLISAAVGKRC